MYWSVNWSEIQNISKAFNINLEIVACFLEHQEIILDTRDMQKLVVLFLSSTQYV